MHQFKILVLYAKKKGKVIIYQFEMLSNCI